MEGRKIIIIIIISSFCWSKAPSRGQDRRSIRENQVWEKLDGCKMMVGKQIPRWFSHFRRSGGDHLPKYHHRRPKRSWRAWCALGVWRLLFTGNVAPGLEMSFSRNIFDQFENVRRRNQELDVWKCGHRRREDRDTGSFLHKWICFWPPVLMIVKEIYFKTGWNNLNFFVSNPQGWSSNKKKKILATLWTSSATDSIFFFINLLGEQLIWQG